LPAGALPRTPLGKLTALPQTPLLVGTGGKPLLQEPIALDSAIRAWSFDLWASPRLRNVDFVPPPLSCTAAAAAADAPGCLCL